MQLKRVTNPFGSDIVQVIHDKLATGSPIRRVEVVDHVPTDGAESRSLSHARVQKGHRVNQTPPGIR